MDALQTGLEAIRKRRSQPNEEQRNKILTLNFYLEYLDVLTK